LRGHLAEKESEAQVLKEDLKSSQFKLEQSKVERKHLEEKLKVEIDANQKVNIFL